MAFVLRMSLCAEPLKIIESVSDHKLNDYWYLKKLIERHFKLAEAGQSEKFRNLAPKSNQTFLDCLSEVRLVLENWLKSANVQRFEDLKSLMVKDRI